MSGMFVTLVGLFFGRVSLTAGQAHLCRATRLYGAFANWLFTTLAGMLGTSDATPIAGSGRARPPRRLSRRCDGAEAERMGSLRDLDRSCGRLTA